MELNSNTDPNTLLRLKIREYAQKQRHKLRDQATDALRFGLGQIKQEIAELDKFGIDDVKGLASRIKRRKHATTEDMYRLSHAFLQGNENIVCFAGIPGASQVLVKELTGPHLERQIEAAECFCNYSLGESFVAKKIATLAGSYFVTYLDSNELRLSRSCVWTLANLLASSPNTGKMLLQMQLIPKLWKIYVAENSELHYDAEICLNLLATTFDEVSQVDRQYISEHMVEKHPHHSDGEYFMFLIYQWEIECTSQLQANHLINFLMDQKVVDHHSIWSIRYGVRVLTNLFYKHSDLVKKLPNFEDFSNKLNRLFSKNNPELNSDLFKMLRNLIELKICDNDLLLDKLRVCG